MNTIGLGNALVDVLLRLKSDDVLAKKNRKNEYDWIRKCFGRRTAKA